MTTGSAGPRPSDRFIPWYIVMFFVFQTVLFGWFTYIAQKTHTGVVTEQAYEKGLAYNDVIEKARQQDALGFSSVIEERDGKISFSLVDHEGRPVQDAKVMVTFFRPVHDGIDTTAEMIGRNGVYTSAVELSEPGLWEVRVNAKTSRGDYQASKRMTIE